MTLKSCRTIRGAIGARRGGERVTDEGCVLCPNDKGNGEKCQQLKDAEMVIALYLDDDCDEDCDMCEIHNPGVRAFCDASNAYKAKYVEGGAG